MTNTDIIQTASAFVEKYREKNKPIKKYYNAKSARIKIAAMEKRAGAVRVKRTRVNKRKKAARGSKKSDRLKQRLKDRDNKMFSMMMDDVAEEDN
jgi:hypothetical protein